MRAILLTGLVLGTLLITPAASAYCGSPMRGIRYCVDTDPSDPLSYEVTSGPAPTYYDCYEVYWTADCCPYPQGCDPEVQLYCIDRLHGPYYGAAGAVGVPAARVEIWHDRVCTFAGCPDIYSACGVYERLFLRAPWFVVGTP